MDDKLNVISDIKNENGEHMDYYSNNESTDIQQQVIAVISEVLSMENLESDTKFEDINVDSISFIKTVVSIEDKFGIEFDDEFLYIEEIPTISAMVEYIKLKMS